MENAINYFNTLPSTQNEIHDFVNQVKEQALDGNIDLIEFAVQLRAVEETIKLLRTDKDIASAICCEAEKYPELRKGGIECPGAKLQIKMTGVSYEYDDDKLFVWEKEMKAIKDKIKKRQDFLKKMTEPVADADTGEILKFPVSRGTEKIIITLNK